MKHTSIFAAVLGVLALGACGQPAPDQPAQSDGYFDNAGRNDVLAGGVRQIPITTPYGDFRVWTKRVGNNPRIKVLILHGGPAMTHEYFEAADSYFPGAGVEYYYYDQLGSYYSDQPDDDRLWEIPRFVDEVEQVRLALGLDKDNFYLLGHSWGGILAMEYALAHQDKVKGLVISNMMASAPAYDAYAKTVLEKDMDPAALAEIKAIEAAEDFANPRYEELLFREHYTKHVLRMPVEQWPDGLMRALKHANFHIYNLMQGPSELGISGRLADWDVTAKLHEIAVPTLVTVAKYDTMDPEHMKWMAEEIPHARALDLAGGSHFAMYDDQQRYFDGVIAFLKDVDEGRFDD